MTAKSPFAFERNPSSLSMLGPFFRAIHLSAAFTSRSKLKECIPQHDEEDEVAPMLLAVSKVL